MSDLACPWYIANPLSLIMWIYSKDKENIKLRCSDCYANPFAIGTFFVVFAMTSCEINK